MKYCALLKGQKHNNHTIAWDSTYDTFSHLSNQNTNYKLFKITIYNNLNGQNRPYFRVVE